MTSLLKRKQYSTTGTYPRLKSWEWLVIRTMMACTVPLVAGPIPVGYRYDAQKQSDSSHCIPLDNFELACKDYRHILQSLERFLTPSREKEVPAIFSKVGACITAIFFITKTMVVIFSGTSIKGQVE